MQLINRYFYSCLHEILNDALSDWKPGTCLEPCATDYSLNMDLLANKKLTNIIVKT